MNEKDELNQILREHPELIPFAHALITEFKEHPERAFDEISFDMLSLFGYPTEIVDKVFG